MKTSQCVTSEQECTEPGFKLLDPLATYIRPGRGVGINERRGLAIAKTPGMMRRMDDGAYGVRSGSSDRWYVAAHSQFRWECTCPFFVRRNIYCKHICAVEAQVIPRDSKVGTVAEVLELIADGMCPRCRTAARMDGVRRNRCGYRRRYRCTGCGLRFSAGFGFEWHKIPPALVAGVPDMCTAGMSLRRIACNIGQGIKDSRTPRRTVSYRAVHRIITRFARGSGEFEDSLYPHVSEKHGTDGMQIGSVDHGGTCTQSSTT